MHSAAGSKEEGKAEASCAWPVSPSSFASYVKPWFKPLGKECEGGELQKGYLGHSWSNMVKNNNNMKEVCVLKCIIY